MAYGGPFNTEAYDKIDENRFRRVADDPLSTFSIDVDTASYANVRRFLNEGTLPPADAVRVEELINYFRFRYNDSQEGAPFSVTTEVAACPWNPRHRLALIGLQARRLDRRAHAAAQSRVPARRLRLDERARQAAAGQDGDADARRHAQRGRPRRDRRLRRRQRARAAVDARRAQGRDPEGDRRAAAGRLDQRRRGHPARLRHRQRRTSSREASTASSSRPTATSTSASRARAS